MTGITTYLSILTLNVNGLTSPIKRHHWTNWIKKKDPTICCLQETYLMNRNKHRLRMKGWKKIYQANGPQKQAGESILTSDKVDFKPTLIKQDKEGHYILIKGK
jgi:exonuclease III